MGDVVLIVITISDEVWSPKQSKKIRTQTSIISIGSAVNLTSIDPAVVAMTIVGFKDEVSVLVSIVNVLDPLVTVVVVTFLAAERKP